MEKVQKYNLGDKLKDSVSGKEGNVTYVYFDTEYDTYYYSIDCIGWYLYPEQDLIKI